MKNHTSDTVTLVKVGGANLVADKDLKAFCGYLKALRRKGRRAVVVHGGGPDIDRLQGVLGMEPRRVEGLRVTEEKDLEVVLMALCGLVNKRLTAACLAQGLPAVGFSGVDGGVLRSALRDEDRLGRVGLPPCVRPDLVREQLQAGRMPVIAPVALAEDGGMVNVNADDAAHALAVSLAAEELAFVSDIPGVKDEQGEVLPLLRLSEARRLIEKRVIHGGMRPKIRAAAEAIRAGVSRVRIGDLAAMRAFGGTAVCI